MSSTAPSAAAGAAAAAVFDVGEVLAGPVEEASFKAALEGHDWSAYRGRIVTLTGCAPLWAYVYVASRLAEHAQGLIVTDGSESGVRVK